MLAIVDAQMLFSDVLLPLAAATVLGGAIGLEREFHGRPAGLRTHIIVCLGSTMIMLVSMQLYHLFPTMGMTSRPDPGRIAAGILTGIGFLGAGAIMKLKSTNRGLTTAACIWFVAALGIVVGVGAYALAVAGTILALGVLMLLARLEHHLGADTYRELILVAARADDLLDRVTTVLTELGITVQAHEFEEEIEKNQIRAIFSVRYRRGGVSEEVLLRRLRALPGVRTIGWRTAAT
jgi:putative Mg2+ transporter-C (MgtC) family protein